MALSTLVKKYIKFALPKEAASNELIDAIDAATSSNSTNTAAIAALDTAKQAKLLTGFAKAASPASDITATDTVLVALGKIQTQMDDADTAIAGKQASLTMNQVTTGTGGTIGQFPVTNMTATGKIIVTPAEALPTDMAFSHVVAGVGIVTVYVINVDTKAVSALDAKKVNYVVISLS